MTTSKTKNAVIQITEKAAKQIKSLLAKHYEKSAGIRVGVKQGGCSGLSYHIEYADGPNPQDEIVKERGVTVFIDKNAIMYLIGTVMDYMDEAVRSGFVFVNPNEKGKCGCGKSFNV